MGWIINLFDNMQQFYAFVILIFTATFAQAQVNEVPIQSNPVLEKHFAEKQQQIQSTLQQLKAKRQGAIVRTGDPVIVNGICIEANTEYSFCKDFLAFGDPADFNLVECTPMMYGNATLTDTSCIFTANPGVELGFDSLCVEVCDTLNVCDTLLLPIIVHRSNETIILPASTLNAEDTMTVCVNTSILPGNFVSSEILGNNSQLGDVYGFDDCIFYEAKRFAGVDTVAFEICDNYCVCDVVKIPFVIQQDTIGLPFMDDFSYEGPYPIVEKWLDKNVFINNTIAANPISIGVATFDGLNERGAPYGGGYGVSDALTSAYLDLSSYNSSSNVYLSFYVEPQGLGDKPLAQDSLILEFKNNNNEWLLIDSYVFNDLPKDTFTFFAYHVNTSQYFFNGFQFRFRNYSKRSGNVDHWHVDYVRLMENSSNSPVFEDIAFTQIPNPVLKTYTSMPWWHFSKNELNEIPEEDFFSEVHIYNHSDVVNAAEDSKLNITELVTGTDVLVDNTLLNDLEPNIPPGFSPLVYPVPPVGSTIWSTFSNAMMNDFQADATYLEFLKTYSFFVGEESSNPDLTVKDNNVVTHTTVFDNYFAYDDGTAESGFEATKKSVQIVQKFHANVDDTLKAVQFHFPHIAVITSNQLFNLRVWVGQLDEEPEFDGILQKPLYIDSYTDSLNGYTTYVLKDFITGERTPLFIPAGEFYVGWQQVSQCDLNQCIAVGWIKTIRMEVTISILMEEDKESVGPN